MMNATNDSATNNDENDTYWQNGGYKNLGHIFCMQSGASLYYEFKLSNYEFKLSKYEFKLSKYEFKLSKYEFKLSNYVLNLCQ